MTAGMRSVQHEPPFHYEPCRDGIHVCAGSEEYNAAYTAADFPLPKSIARQIFETARSELACEDGDNGDLTVDLTVDGNIVDDFCIYRQMLPRLAAMCAALAAAQEGQP